MRDQRDPVLGGRGLDGRGADLEVRAGVVVQHEEDVLAADDRVVERVLQSLAARAEDPEAGVGVAGVEDAVLRGDLGPGGDDDEPVAAAAAHAHEEPAVLLVVDELVVGLRGAEAVPPDLVRAPRVVDGRVVEVPARRVPRGAAVGAEDLVGAVLAGGDVEDADRVALVADHVCRVGEQGAVRADARPADGEELVALGQGIHVQQQLLAGQRGLVGRAVLGGPRWGPVVGVGHRDPAAGAVLLALERTAVVPVPPVAGRHRQVGLAGPRLDLVEDRLAQVGQVRGLRLGVLVLRLQVGHHLGGALGAQPLVVVDAGPAVVLGGDGATRCQWWGNDRRLGRELRGVLHKPEPISGPLAGGAAGVEISSTGSGWGMWTNHGICGATPNSCGAICGTRRMSKFLRRTPCAPLRAGHRTSPPINQRPSRNGDRGSGRNEDPHREATRGVGPVTGSTGSERLPGRGGRHPASSLEGLLVLIPSRGPHPCFRSGIGPAGSRAGPESQPVRRRRVGTQAAAGSPEVAWDPDDRRLRPEVIRIRNTAGLPEVDRDPDSNESSTPRGNSRRRPDDGDGGRRRSWPDGVVVITTSTRGPLGAHTTR